MDQMFMDQMDQMFIHNKDFHLEIWNIFSPSKQLWVPSRLAKFANQNSYSRRKVLSAYHQFPFIWSNSTFNLYIHSNNSFYILYLSLNLKITDFQSNVMPVSQDHFYSIHETQDRPTKPYYNNSHHLWCVPRTIINFLPTGCCSLLQFQFQLLLRSSGI